MSIARCAVKTLSFGLMFFGCGTVTAQEYPSKTVRVVTALPGGGADFTARQVSQGIAGPFHQPVVIDNRANAFAAGEVVAKAAPDGYSLLVCGAGLWLTPLFQKVSYDMANDFVPISLVERSVAALAVHPSLPVKSTKELIALAKARPGELNYASSTTAGMPHLAGELFKSLAGVNIVRVVYKGSASGITATVGGEMQVILTDTGLVLPQAKAGRLRALAVTSAEPTALAPGLPTLAASGVPGYELVGATAMFAPGKTPTAIVTRVYQEVARALAIAEVKERFLKAGVEVVASSPDQLAATIRSDQARIGKLIKDANITSE
jgi:tripartite-type tricarboxylate transporter receptor subunit TctC